MSEDRLQQWGNQFPKGSLWLKGEELEELVEILIEDRARLMPGSGDEIPTTSGRFFRSNTATDAGSVYPDFYILQRPKPDGSGTIQWAVMPGYLGYGDVPSNPVTVSGVSASADSPTWNDWDGNTGNVWIEATAMNIFGTTIEDQLGDTVKINADCLGGSFDPTAAPWSGDNAFVYGTTDETVSTMLDQTLFKKWIASFTASSGKLVIAMKVSQPIELVYEPIAGQPAIYPREQA